MPSSSVSRASRLVRLPAVDAAQALVDLTEISSQVRAAALGTSDGALVASTLPDDRSGNEFLHAALELLAAAEDVRRKGDDPLVQLEAATGQGSVFLVRDGRHVAVAVTTPKPTSGLVFYGLRTCLRLLGEEPEEKPKRRRRRPKKEDGDAGS